MCVCNDAHPGFAIFARVSACGRKSSRQRGCMNAIGKDKLWSLRQYYFSLTGDEQDTYLATKMQMVKAIWSDIKISFEYYLFPVQHCY